MRINCSSALILMAHARLSPAPLPPASWKPWPNLWCWMKPASEHLRVRFPETQEHLCKWNMPAKGFGSWVWLGTSILETVPCPVSVLSQGPGASPPPCAACPYAGCISLEKLWRITPTGMAICPLTDIAWALQAHQDRILKHLVHYITALWWMDFTRACPLGRTNYVQLVSMGHGIQISRDQQTASCYIVFPAEDTLLLQLKALHSESTGVHSARLKDILKYVFFKFNINKPAPKVKTNWQTKVKNKPQLPRVALKQLLF